MAVAASSSLSAAAATSDSKIPKEKNNNNNNTCHAHFCTSKAPNYKTPGFRGCTNLQSVTLPLRTSVTRV